MMSYIQLFILFVFLSGIVGCSVSPQIVHFEATPAILKGESAQITWQVISTPRHHIQLKGLKDNLPSEGAFSFQPNQTTEVALQVSFKKKGKVQLLSEIKNISVVEPEPQPTFTGTTETSAGNIAELSWKLPSKSKEIVLEEYAQGKKMNHWSGLAHQASYQIRPLHDTEFRLKFANEQGIFEQLIHCIKVQPAYFSGTQTILYGQKAQLIWKVNQEFKHLSLEKKENAYTREILYNQLPSQGNMEVSPLQTTEYILSGIGESKTKFSHTVQVLNILLNGQNQIEKGNEAQVTWLASNQIRQIRLEELIENGKRKIIQESLPIEGRIQLKPEKTTQYFFVWKNEKGEENSTEWIVFVRKNDTYFPTNPQPNRIYQANSTKIPLGIQDEESPIYSKALKIVYQKTIIRFNFNETQIENEYAEVLEKILAYLQEHTETIVEIVGHADMKGSIQGCLNISQQRAERVKNLLLQKNIPSHRIITRSLGRTQPIHYVENTPEKAAENRRVEILVWAQ